MYRQFTLPAGASLTAQVRFDIEADWDYAYLIVSTDGGTTWTNVATNLSTNTNPNGQNFGNGITGSTAGNWVALTADLSAYTGDVLLGFRYWTDAFVAERGFMVDELSVSGNATDGAESDTGWTFVPASGFSRATGAEKQLFFNAYVAEFRQYRGYDTSLRTAYNFGFLEHEAGMGRELPLPGWLADQLLGCVQGRQQHELASRLGPDPAHRRTSRCDEAGRRCELAQPCPDIRLDLHVGANRPDHAELLEPAIAASQPAGGFGVRRRDTVLEPGDPGRRRPESSYRHRVRIKSISAQGTLMQVQVN